MLPELVRRYAEYLASTFASYARKNGMSADDVISLKVWAMARLAEGDYELLRTTKLSQFPMLVVRLFNEYRAASATGRTVPAVELGQELWVRVKCLDVEVGTATFALSAGLAHTTFEPSVDYSMVAPYAQAIGKWLAVRHYWTPMDGDVTDFIAEQWRGERLCLEDHLGRELSVCHIIIAERKHPPHNLPRLQLVADFRPADARIAAVVPTGDIGSGGRTRPSG